SGRGVWGGAGGGAPVAAPGVVVLWSVPEAPVRGAVLAQPLEMGPGAVVDDLDDDLAELLARAHGHLALRGLAGGDANARRLDAVRHRVADQVQHRLEQRVDDRLVEVDVRAAGLQANLAALALRRIAPRPLAP